MLGVNATGTLDAELLARLEFIQNFGKSKASEPPPRKASTEASVIG